MFKISVLTAFYKLYVYKEIQELIGGAIVSPVVKYYHLLNKPEDVKRVIERAYHTALEGRPGNLGSRPAHFAIQTADVILVLGSRLSLNTTGHTPTDFAPKTDKYIVDIDSVEFEKPGIEFKKMMRSCQYLLFIQGRWRNYLETPYRSHTVPSILNIKP